MRNVKPITHPLDYFYQASDVTHSTILEDDNKLFYFDSDNDFCRGTGEFLPFEHGCYSFSVTGTFHEGFYNAWRFQYKANWLQILIRPENDRCLFIIDRFSKYREASEYEDKYQLILLDDRNITWHQAAGSSADKIVLFISDDWLQKALSFFPALKENNWKHIRGAVRGKGIREQPITDSIPTLTIDILKGLSDRGTCSIQNRQRNLNQLAHRCISFILGHEYSLWTEQQKVDLQKIILAEKELTSNFRTPPLSLKELSKITGLNRRKFQELFKEYYGKPFFQYYQEARFLYAKELIEKEGFNISEAAYMTGFKHVSYFSKYFESITGIKPSKLKQGFLNK
jgi:AraC-like DNA-binding protein